MEINELNKNANGGTELMGRRLQNLFPKETFDKFQIISSRVRNIDEDRKVILWLHDLARDPEVAHLANDGWREYDMLVFVSHAQQRQYNEVLGVPYEAGTVIENAIEPLPMKEKRDDGKIKLIYTSTPHRGLAILHPVFEFLKKNHFKNIELDVYSSFGLYGWEERDKPYKPLFEALKATDGVTYHGTKSNEEVRKALTQSDIFVYPSVWEETSCLCLIEAMSAGLVCVHSSLGALPETSMGITRMYNYTENTTDHANRFAAWLGTIILNYNNYNQDISKYITDNKYNLELFKSKWQDLFESMD